jgi:hypothetical protein
VLLQLDMSKFALKTYNRFTKDTEAGAPSVAHFLLSQPSTYILKGDKSVTINFHWVKVHFRKGLNDLLNKGLEEVAEDPFAALIPVLGYSTESIKSLLVLQASFQDNPTIDCLLRLVTAQFPLNLKQGMVARALFLRILYPIPIKSVDDQFLLYLGGVGGVGKTYLIKVFIFGLSIMHKEDNVLLTASTGAAASNVGGATLLFCSWLIW